MDEYDDVEEVGEVVKEYTLTEGSELRLECDNKTDVFLLLLEGSAEIFGAELQLGSKISIRGQQLAVFTWKGCKLQVEGRTLLSYEASDTPMASYLELHTRLNTMRDAAKQRQDVGAIGEGGKPDKGGPRVLVVGPTDSGKSSLCRMLLNWGVRTGWEPTFADLDVGQGSITAPGCIAALPVDAPVDPGEGSGTQDVPLVLFYGHLSPSDNPELYKFLIDRLAGILDKRAATNPMAKTSGLVINTLGWTDGLGYELQLHAIQALQADVVVVLDQDRLYSQLSAELKGRGVHVMKLVKSGGVVKRDKEKRRSARDGRLREYFYGYSNELMPVTQTLRADQLKVFRIGGGPRAPTSALPIGAVASAPDSLRVSHLPVTAELVQSLLAVSHAETPDQVLSSNVAGFVLVKEVDTVRNLVTFVSPCPGPLPGRYLLSGSVRSNLD